MNNFNDMISKAKEMQEKLKAVQESIKKIEVEGVSGGCLLYTSPSPRDQA